MLRENSVARGGNGTHIDRVTQCDRATPAGGANGESVSKVRHLPVIRSQDPTSGGHTTGLSVFRNYVPRAGHPDWARMAREADDIVRSVRPDLVRPQMGRALRQRRRAALRTAITNLGRNIRRHRSGREDLLPLYFVWTLLRACNFSCAYCDDHRGERYPDLPSEGTLTPEHGLRLLEIMRTGTPSVYFAGGEPLMRTDLPALSRAAVELQYFPIVVNTNASLIHRRLRQASWRTWLADTDIVVVSLDALDLEVLHSMWGYRRAEDVVRNLLVLRRLSTEMGFQLMVNTVIQPGMVAHARDVLDLASDLDIKFCPVPRNVGPRADRDLLADPDYFALVQSILERKREGQRIAGSSRMLRKLLWAEPYRCRNALKPHVDHDGSLLWPCKASVHVEPVRINALDFDNVDALFAHATSLIDPTEFQGFRADQCGAHCNWAQNYSTDTYVRGLSRPLRLVQDVAAFVRGG